MVDSRAWPTIVGIVVAATLLATGPAVGVIDVGTPETGADLGDGNATVASVEFVDDSLGIERGRFGAGVYYLRIPDVEVSFGSVEGSGRVVYGVRVPELEFERVATERFAESGDRVVRAGMSDRAFAPETVRRSTYRATITVRVQSFAVDRTAFHRNVTVQVRQNG